MEKEKNLTKEEMFKYINEKIKENKISDDIVGFFLFIEDNKLGSTCSIGNCSEVSLLEFLAKGIINLARYKNADVPQTEAEHEGFKLVTIRYKNIAVLQTAIDVLHLACDIDEAEQQNKKEQEGA
ncbi:hypothetical protein [Megamonas funiformis]|uniref:hypothetical protein n=1 Tax=Megamonas funiformis TaxID=437897 RepID=UPI003F803B8A